MAALGDLQIHAHLQQQLNVEVSAIDINVLFDPVETMSLDLQAHCFAAIGAAIGEELL